MFAGTIAAGGAFLFLFDPAVHSLFPRCPFYVLTGWYCPGCGSLRATHQLLHGNVCRAIAFNPALLPAIAAAFAISISRRLRDNPATPKVILIALLAYGVLRNMPMWPFVFLAPH